MTNLIGMTESFPDLAEVALRESFCRITFARPMSTFSNAPWLGGFQPALNGLLNLKVSKIAEVERETGEPEPLDRTFTRSVQEQQLSGHWAGMMTAASMKSFRYQYEDVEGYSLLVCVTAGLNNARRVGDAADDPLLHFSPEQPLPVGTINLMMVTAAPLSQAAALEAFALLTEAKTAAGYDKGVGSPVSGKTATGTGTDATLVAIPTLQQHTPVTPEILYCGKHTLLGERIGHCAYAILSDTLQACLDSG